MKCFYDRTQDAVGICKSCGKGISSEYAVDLGKGLACKDRCEEDARALIALIDSNVSMRATSQKLILGSGRTGMYSSIFLFLMGAMFFVSGIMMKEGGGQFPLIMGSLFIVWSFVGFARSFAIQRTIGNLKDGKPGN